MIGDIEARLPYIAVKLLLNTTVGPIHAHMDDDNLLWPLNTMRVYWPIGPVAVKIQFLLISQRYGGILCR